MNSLKLHEKELELFKKGCRPIRLLRPCTLGDGIKKLSEEEERHFIKLYEDKIAAGGVMKMVPASGAASRMFRDLPVGSEWEKYRDLPKGMIPFHRYGKEIRTAFEEQLIEAPYYLQDRKGLSRVHFTVANEHEEKIRNHIDHFLKQNPEIRWEVSFSLQDQSTDTPVVDLQNNPAKDANGNIILWPSGHGALLQNLQNLDAEIVFLKNIDNISWDPGREELIRYKKVLGGCLVELQSGTSDRPSRVSGMIRHRGEPGGGPFWVQHADGSTSLQIVESAQIDHGDPEQEAIFASSTHFNPVDLVCGLRDPQGRPFDLPKFVDSSTWFIARKTYRGREIKTLERPGLWNGGMAYWNTIFIEVPEFTFTPVKTVMDLLRPEHQG